MLDELCSLRVTALLQLCEHARGSPVDPGSAKARFPMKGLHLQMRDDVRGGAAMCCGRGFGGRTLGSRGLGVLRQSSRSLERLQLQEARRLTFGIYFQ